jgi:hypothetical protein
MRRGWLIVLAIVVVMTIVGVAFGAYHAGVDEGVRRAADAGQVVEVVGGYGWRGGGWGFFPFGLILFPLLLLGIFALIGGAFRRGPWGDRWSDHDHGPGGWRAEAGARSEDRFREWHARQHEQGSPAPDPGGGAAA